MTSDITACDLLLGLIRETDVSEINQNPLLCPKMRGIVIWVKKRLKKALDFIFIPREIKLQNSISNLIITLTVLNGHRKRRRVIKMWRRRLEDSQSKTYLFVHPSPNIWCVNMIAEIYWFIFTVRWNTRQKQSAVMMLPEETALTKSVPP